VFGTDTLNRFVRTPLEVGLIAERNSKASILVGLIRAFLDLERISAAGEDGGG